MMAEQWYCQLDGEQVGPIDAAQLQGLARRGRLTAETLVRPASKQNWVPAGKVGGLKFSPPSTPSVAAAPPTLKKAKPLEPNISPAQVQRMSDSNALAAGIVPPPLPSHVQPGYGPDQFAAPPPPPAGFDPASIPTGIPIGTAVGAPLPAGSVPYSPPSAGPAPWININAAPTTPSASRGLGEEKQPLDKKRAARRKLGWMVGGVAGVVLALGVVGAILVVSGRNAASDKQPQVAKKGLDEELAEAAAAEAASGASARPNELAEVSSDKDGAQEDAGGPSKSSKSPSAASASTDAAARRAADPKKPAPGDIAAAAKSVSRWFDLANSSAVSSKTMKLQMTGAWLDDGSGDDKSADGDKPAPARATAARIYVELRIANPQTDAPLNYTPWNGDGAGGTRTLALLATADGSACALVPVSKTKEPSRQTAPLRIKPGQAVTELLVFEAPPGDYESLQLLLPTSAIGQSGRYLGLKIPRDIVAARKPVELAQEETPSRAVNANTREAPGAGASPKIIANSEPAAVPPPAPKPRDETIDDLRKSIGDSVKEKQKEKDEAVAKEREANKKKPD